MSLKHLKSIAFFIATAGLAAASFACEGPVDFKHTTKFTVILNAQDAAFEGEPGTTADVAIPPAPLHYGVPIDLASQNPELADYAEAGLFTETTIDQVTYTVTRNTLTADLNDIQIAVGDPDTTNPADGILLAQIDQIKAQDTPSGEANLFPEDQPAAAARIQTLQFGAATGTDLGVDAGAPIPDGFIQVDIELFLTLTADPL